MPQDCDGWVSLGEVVEQVMVDLKNKMVGSDPTILLRLLKAAELVGGLGPKELAGKSHSRSVAVVRHAVMWIAHKHLGLSGSSIGRVLDRDHTTVIHGVQKVQERVDRKSGKTLRLIEAILDAMAIIAKGGTVTPVKKLVTPVKPQVLDDPPKPLKHWRFYPVCSEEWWRSNELSFREGMIKARARVSIDAGE